MRRRALVRGLVAGAVLATGSACGGPQPDTSGCAEADDRLVAAAAARLTVPASLRHGHLYRSERSGRVFLSAELDREEDIWSAAGDIVTWMVVDEHEPRLEAVDEVARTRSSWPSAGFTPADDADVVTSRGCSLVERGTLDLDQHEIDCPERGAARRACLDDRREELEDRLTREHDERRNAEKK